MCILYEGGRGERSVCSVMMIARVFVMLCWNILCSVI